MVRLFWPRCYHATPLHVFPPFQLDTQKILQVLP
jgi:hypothetical protein